MRTPRTLIRLAGLAVAAAFFLTANTAWATWTSFEYRNAAGEYRYGVKDGSSKLKLGLKKRKQADKTAGQLNDADKVDEEGEEK